MIEKIITSFTDLDSRPSSKLAALDIGSNSFHLVVTRIVADSVQILHSVKQKVRFLDGLDKDDMLSEKSIQNGLNTLALMAESLQGFAPDTVRIVATHTLRKAVNAQKFIKAAKTILPYPIEIISGTEEARLIYLGVAHTSHLEGKNLIIDIGGGSTEFAIGEGFESKLLCSLEMGCISYGNKYFESGELKTKAFNKAITAAQQELEFIDKRFIKLGWQQAIGCSGTIKAIVDIVQNLNDDGQQNNLTLQDLQNLISLCCQAGHIDKLEFKSLTEDRQSLLPSGLCILTAIFLSLRIENIAFSPAALREGVIYEMEDSPSHSDIRQRTAESLAKRYDVDTEQANRVLNTTINLYSHCNNSWQISQPELKNMLIWSALLHEVGLQINSRGVQRHSAYILQHIDMPGFNQDQQNLLATLVRFHRKKIRTNEILEFAEYQPEQVIRLIALLRLSVLLNIKRQADILPDYTIKAENSTLTLLFPEGWLEKKTIFSADLASEAEYLDAVNITLKFS